MQGCVTPTPSGDARELQELQACGRNEDLLRVCTAKMWTSSLNDNQKENKQSSNRLLRLLHTEDEVG